LKPITDQAYKLFHNGSIALAQVSSNGIRIDTDYLHRQIKSVSHRILKIEELLKQNKIYKVWRRRYRDRFTFGSRTQLGNVLFETMGYDPSTFTKKTGRAKADEAALKSIKEPFINKYLLLERLKKTRSTYLKGILRETIDGFVHPNFPLHLVRSYRGSSDHPNFTNIPMKDPQIKKLVRRAFISRKNHRLIEIDFKGAEICSATCYHKDPAMIKYIQNPKLDLHRDMGAQCYKVKKGQVTWGIRDCGKNRFVFAEFYGDWYITRAPDLWGAIKTMNLKVEDTGCDLYSHLETKGIYELGDCDPDKEPREGTFEKHIKEVEYDFWNRRFRVYNQWKKDWYNKYLKLGYFDTLTGFRIESVLNRKQVINYGIQGSAFHWLLWCLIKIQRILNKYKMKSFIIGQIHDSIVSDVHKDEMKDYLDIVKQVIYEDIRKHWKWIIVPLVVECEMSPVDGNWYEKIGVEI